MRPLGRKGAVGAMGLITLGVAIMIGAYVTGTVWNSVAGDAASVTVDGRVETLLNNTLTNAGTGFTLMAMAIIVGAAIFILGIMGSRS